jgi:hypothetical protein
MKKLMLLVVVALVAVPVALAAKPTTPGSNGTGGKALVAKLTGSNAQAHAGDHGNVVVRLNVKTLKVCWSYSNLKLTRLGSASATPTASHIHTGAAGATGGVLVPFGATFARSGCTTTTKEIINSILANPSGF